MVNNWISCLFCLELERYDIIELLFNFHLLIGPSFIA